LFLELIEPDMLDVSVNRDTDSGKIRVGVERDARNRVVAYYFKERHPGDVPSQGIRGNNTTRRVKADDIVHYFLKDRPTQSIGVPWCTSAMTGLKHLDDYQEAELLASKQAAQKGGYFQSDRGDVFAGEEEVNLDEDGNKVVNTLNDFEPASFDELPPGMTFVPYQPNHPVDAFEKFIKSTLFGLAAGLDVDYPTLTGDLSQANYSSMRAGKLESQETYKKVQNHFISHFCLPIFEGWLRMAILSGQVNLPMSNFEKYNNPKFRGRRWPWVDPTKDMTAAISGIEAGLRTRTDVIAEAGGDLEETFEQLAEEERKAKELGLSFVKAEPKPEGNGQEPANGDADDSETDTGDTGNGANRLMVNMSEDES
jgi:lambda family phage portal protein